jgi:hypothetical protein
MNSQKFQSVWDAIEDTPQAAASMQARSTLNYPSCVLGAVHGQVLRSCQAYAR